MKIVALDLGKFNSVACMYQTADGGHEFCTIKSEPGAIHELLLESQAQRVVIEVGANCGWVKDLAEAMGCEVEVANVNAESWQWKKRKRKTDRDDALKLAVLSARGELPRVHVPCRQVRQWRSLIGYRQDLVVRRTAIKNRIRALLTQEAHVQPGGKKGWTDQALEALKGQGRGFEACGREELWRGILQMELMQLEAVERLIGEVEKKLEALSEKRPQVKLLRTIPGVGPRLAEVVVAVIDDPRRFNNRKQVGCYAGLTPRQFESGTMVRQGRISCQGNRLLRALLVEVSWLMRRWNDQFWRIFQTVSKGSKQRRKAAIVAVARRLLVTCWAMLRDNKPWRPAAGVADAAQAA
jgi:transposase